MTLPAALFAVRWLVRDTFRQARATGLTATALAVTAVVTAVCLTVSVRGDPAPIPTRDWEERVLLPRAEAQKNPPADLEGVDVPGGELGLLWGAFRIPLTRSRVEAVRFLQAVLAGGVADTAGVLLALVWTAGFLPTFFEPATATVLIAKPFSRTAVLAGKVFAVLTFVGVQALIFAAAVWLALGLRTGVWDGRMFATVPLLLLHFGCFYAVSVLLAVVTRSAVVSVLGTMEVWFGCWWVNFARHAAFDHAGPLLNAGYWLLPKPADFGTILLRALGAQDAFAQAPAVATALGQGALHPELSLLTACLFPATALALAAWRFERAEY